MKFPFYRRSHYNKLFPTTNGVHLRQLRHMLETNQGNKKPYFSSIINNSIYSHSRSVQAQNIRNLNNNLLSNSFANGDSNNSFIEYLLINNLRNILNNNLQSTLMGSERRISPAKYSENQIASQLYKILVSAKRNL